MARGQGEGQGRGQGRRHGDRYRAGGTGTGTGQVARRARLWMLPTAAHYPHAPHPASRLLPVPRLAGRDLQGQHVGLNYFGNNLMD